MDTFVDVIREGCCADLRTISRAHWLRDLHILICNASIWGMNDLNTVLFMCSLSWAVRVLYTWIMWLLWYPYWAFLACGCLTARGRNGLNVPCHHGENAVTPDLALIMDDGHSAFNRKTDTTMILTVFPLVGSLAWCICNSWMTSVQGRSAAIAKPTIVSSGTHTHHGLSSRTIYNIYIY